MALDPNIYQNIDTQYGLKLASLMDPVARQQRETAAESASLENAARRMQVMQSMQQMKAAPALQQRAEQARIAEQKKQNSQELDMFIANSISSGMPKEQVFQSAAQRAKQYGFNDDETRAGLEPLMTLQDPREIHKHYLTSAMPEEAGKAKLKQMFQEPKAGMTQEQQRGQIIFDNQGNAYNVNPYTNEVRPVSTGGKQIQGAQYAPSLQGQISGARAIGTETGKATGEAITGLKDIQSQMPNLEKLVTDLSDLGKKATYTKTGQALDITKRQLGMGVGTGAVARKEYISKVDNEILPLLRQTFGAAFTVKEGESLRATLGDPDASPEEKDAVLRSFITTKKAQIGSLQRRTGEPSSPTQTQSGATASGW